MHSNQDRFTRQADLVPQDKLAAVGASVIGVGAIGRQVALQLAALGIRRLQLVDFDKVELTNVTTQGYYQDEIGQSKVSATAAVIKRIDPAIELDAILDRYRPQLSLQEAVFCCVDKIETRAAIWRSAAARCRFWVDGRMLGETLRVLTACDPQSRQHYDATLFPAAQAQPGSCTSRATIHAAAIAAGLMVQQFCLWLRRLPAHCDATFNLLAGEFTGADSGN